jgi:hypothetical protein
VICVVVRITCFLCFVVRLIKCRSVWRSFRRWVRWRGCTLPAIIVCVTSYIIISVRFSSWTFMRRVYFICDIVYFNCNMCEFSAAHRNENGTVLLSIRGDGWRFKLASDTLRCRT